MALQLAFFFSIMPQAISITLVMLFLLERCWNDQKMAGLTERKDRKCAIEPMGSATLLNIFISRMTHDAWWFKGVENIIRERGMWPENGLNAQCEGFKCVPGRVDCCCRHLLFSQPDFIAQKSQLEEYITSCGHICDFDPNFHCELNFIEQYWGAVKFHYRSSPRTSDMDAMEKNVLACLDSVGAFIQLNNPPWAYFGADLQMAIVPRHGTKFGRRLGLGLELT